MDDREKLYTKGLNALRAKYPRDMVFANAGFAIGVVHCIVDAVLADANKTRDGNNIHDIDG